MSLSMYQASVPVFVQLLDSIAYCLDRGAEDAARRKIDLAVLANTRLTVDMMPLAQQIQVATNHATGAPARLAGLDLPPLGDNEKNIDEVKGRIARALAFLKSLRPEQIDGTEEKEIVLPRRARVSHIEQSGLSIDYSQYPHNLYPMTFRGREYLLNFAMPNFYFHIAMTYAILRRSGVALGKMDYMGRLPRLDLPPPPPG